MAFGTFLMVYDMDLIRVSIIGVEGDELNEFLESTSTSLTQRVEENAIDLFRGSSYWLLPYLMSYTIDTIFIDIPCILPTVLSTPRYAYPIQSSVILINSTSSADRTFPYLPHVR